MNDTPRWATPEEFGDPRSMAQTPEGKPAFWAAIVIEGPNGSNLPEELVRLGGPIDASEGRGMPLRLTRTGYSGNYIDPTWSWKRGHDGITLFKYGVPYVTLDEPST